MVRRKEPALVPREFRTAREIDNAIGKLERRAAEVESLAGKPHDDPAVQVVEDTISRTILDIYGSESPEYRDYQGLDIYFGPRYIGTPFHETSVQDQRGFEAGIPHVVATLRGLMEALREKREEVSPTSAISLVSAEALHPRISAVALELYRDGHYAQAVTEGAKALVNVVKEKARSELDGVPLMTSVFSKNKPILAWNGLQDQTDVDEQQGMMHLFAGAVLAIRNPRSHKYVKDTRDSADELLGLLSFLARRVDESHRA